MRRHAGNRRLEPWRNDEQLVVDDGGRCTSDVPTTIPRAMERRSPTSPSSFRGRSRRNRSSAVALVLLAACLAAVCSSAATGSRRLAPPHSLQVRAVSKTSIHLSWVVSPSAVPVAGFRVYVNGALRASVRGTSYRIGDLRCGTSYVLAVAAYDHRGRRSKLRSRRVSTTQCGGGCFASPGSCRYPDPAYHNVGVPHGTTLTPSGDVTVRKNGTVIKGLDVTGSIDVQANNVTIQNTRITCGCGRGFGVNQAGGYSGLTIKDSEISGGNVGFFGSGTKTVNHVYMWNCDECIQYGKLITDSYLYVSAEVSGAHYEASYNNNATEDVEHTVIFNPHEQTATIFMDTSDATACQDNLTVNNSLLAGGGYLIYPCGESTSAGSSHSTITNNRFARCTTRPVVDSAGGYICQGHGSPSGDGDVVGNPDANGYYPNGGFFGAIAYIYCNQTTWSNNVWDNSGAATTC